MPNVQAKVQRKREGRATQRRRARSDDQGADGGSRPGAATVHRAAQVRVRAPRRAGPASANPQTRAADGGVRPGSQAGLTALGRETAVVQAFGASVMMPGYAMPFRSNPAGLTAQSVAVAQPWSLESMAMPAANSYIDAAQTLFFLRREPACASIRPVAAPGPFAYAAQFSNDGAPSTTIPIQCDANSAREYLITPDVWVSAIPSGGVDTSAPHGEFLYPQLHDDQTRFVWIDGIVAAPTIVEVLPVAAFPAGAIVTFSADYYHNGSVQLAKYDSGGSAVISIPQSGYYRLRLNLTCVAASINTTAAITITNDGLAEVYAHYVAPGLEATASSFDTLAITAMSLNWENTTPVIDLGGKMAGKNFAGNIDWTTIVTATNEGPGQGFPTAPAGLGDPYTYIARANRGASHNRNGMAMSATKGCFTCMFPLELNLLAQQPMSVTYNDGSKLLPLPYLKPKDNYKAFAASLPLGTPPTGEYRINTQVEFQTSNTFFVAAEPTVDSIAYQGMWAIVAKGDQWYENPSHWAAIKGFLRDFGKGFARGLGNTLMAGSGELGLLGGAAANLAGKSIVSKWG